MKTINFNTIIPNIYVQNVIFQQGADSYPIIYKHYIDFRHNTVEQTFDNPLYVFDRDDHTITTADMDNEVWETIHFAFVLSNNAQITNLVRNEIQKLDKSYWILQHYCPYVNLFMDK